jgi:histidine ammonia-lyase
LRCPAKGFRANLSLAFVPHAQDARPAPGQAEAAARLLGHSIGGLAVPGAARRVQDPLSFRCVAQVHGAAHDALARAVQHVEIELNAAADSPLIDAGKARLISTGNFYIPGLALAHETLGLAIAQVATLLVERCIKMFRLQPRAAAATHAPQPAAIRIRHHAETAHRARRGFVTSRPGMLDFLPVPRREDHATWRRTASPSSARHARQLVHLISRAVIAAQAVDCGRPMLNARFRRAPVYEGVRALGFSTTTVAGADFAAVAGSRKRGRRPPPKTAQLRSASGAAQRPD